MTGSLEGRRFVAVANAGGEVNAETVIASPGRGTSLVREVAG